MVSNSILSWAISSGIPFRSLYVQANTSLNSFRNLINNYVTTNSSATFNFTYCTFSLVPKLTLVSCSSLIIIRPTMVRSCIHSQVGVSSIIISPFSRWEKVLGRCCLTVSSGITKLTTKTHTGSTNCFRIDFAILRFGMQTGLESCSIWIGISLVLIENKSNYVANITSSSSFDILKWKS